MQSLPADCHWYVSKFFNDLVAPVPLQKNKVGNLKFFATLYQKTDAYMVKSNLFLCVRHGEFLAKLRVGVSRLQFQNRTLG